MGYQLISVWSIVRRFLIGWVVVLGILVVVSCVKYWDFIMAAVTNNIWAFFYGMMPVVIIATVIVHMLKDVFKRN
ncbi:hypothetical protein AALA00_10575 [Lachnospiraceae bacterium 46-15]